MGAATGRAALRGSEGGRENTWPSSGEVSVPSMTSQKLLSFFWVSEQSERGLFDRGGNVARGKHVIAMKICG